jgi:hypothetical protein
MAVAVPASAAFVATWAVGFRFAWRRGKKLEDL